MYISYLRYIKYIGYIPISNNEDKKIDFYENI